VSATVITIIEKTLTYLAMPCGLIWLGLIALTFLAWRRKQRAMLISLSVLLAFYTLAGNEEVTKLLFVWLERDYAKIDPFEQGPYDAVFVLGGGIGVGANGEPQLEMSGDRAALGARLYHTGRTQRLVAMGTTILGPDGEPRNLDDEVTRIWRQWAVPDEHILQLSGRNTREEMAAIRQMVDTHPEWKRLGLVTSAWHMRRATRLAENNGLSLEPLPANFRGTPPQWRIWSLIIPSGGGFFNSQQACKEILASLVGK
jgi:uncharacterized SAM-binding protein YcdF (DUF218 family)